MRTKNLSELSRLLNMPEEKISLLYISMVLLHCIMKNVEAERIWAPGVTLCDGIAYEYAEKNKIITLPHDFEKDIIACAQSISKRYQGSKKRSETLEQIALAIFDGMKKFMVLVKGKDCFCRLQLFYMTVVNILVW